MEDRRGSAVACPACDHANRPDRRYCAKCGDDLGWSCEACGARNEPEAEFCGRCAGQPTARAASRAGGRGVRRDSLPEERRHLTVMFCDLVDSTAIAARLDPEDWQEVTARYQAAATETVARFGGHVARYVGDGLLVYFGYPEAHEDDAERAARAGLALVDAMATLNRLLEPVHGACLAIRVGIHTGDVILDETADVFGDTPNVAARMQGLAMPDTVVISAATHHLLSGRLVVQDLGARVLKGVQDPVSVFRVLQPSRIRSRLAARSLRGVTPFVGRDEQRRALLERWTRTREGDGQVLHVAGEAGIGKSRLVETLREAVSSEPHTWIECAGSSYHQHTPFHPIIEMLQQAFAPRGDETPAERLCALEHGVSRAGLSLAEAVPLLASLLAMPAPAGYSPLGLSAEAERRRTFATLTSWLFGMARSQPVVFVVEDLHWVDPSTLELQALLVEQGANLPLLIVHTARHEFRAPWPLLAHHTQLTLNRLSSPQVREMIRHLAAGRALSAELVDSIVAHTDGVPLFVEELTRTRLEHNGGTAARTIPTTLHDSLMARLDRLGGAKEVAQLGAVIGREFSYALLRSVWDAPEPALEAALAKLAEAELIYPRGRPPEATYLFKHALVQHTAYESLLKRRRQSLHARVARVLEERFPTLVEAEAEVVARHYELAGLGDQAIIYYQQAGEQAAARSAHEEAIRDLRQAIALLATLPESASRDAREVQLQLLIGSSAIAVRGYAHPEAEAAYARAQALCESVKDLTQLAHALAGLAMFHTSRGEPDSSIRVGQRLLAVARESTDESHLLSAHDQIAMAEHFKGRFTSSLEHTERALEICERSDLGVARHGTDHGVAARGYMAWNMWHLGYPDRAAARAEDAVELATALGHPYSLCFALFFRVVVHWLRGQTDAQLAGALRVFSLAAAQGFPLWRGGSGVLRAAALAASGEGVAALAEVSDSLAQVAATGNRGAAPALLAALAEAHQAAGQHAEAMGVVETALAISDETGQAFWDAELHRRKGELTLVSQAGSEPQAEQLFRRAFQIAQEQGARSQELRAATSLARLLRSHGRLADARATLAPVYGWFAEGFDTHDLVEAKALLESLG